MSAREDFEGVTIHDSDHFALILSDNDSRRERQESAEQNEEPQSAIIHNHTRGSNGPRPPPLIHLATPLAWSLIFSSTLAINSANRSGCGAVLGSKHPASLNTYK